MNGKHWIIIGAVSAALAVGMGAFGAHGLEGWLEKNFELDEQISKTENWNSAARYQMWHAIGMVLLGLAALRIRSKQLAAAGFLMLIGTALFSGVMYVYVLTGTRALGMVLPFGGLAFMIGWLLFAGGVAMGQARESRGD